MTWKVRYEERFGSYYWLSGERRWSDSFDDAIAFDVEADALKEADNAKSRLPQFSKVHVVKFKEVK